MTVTVCFYSYFKDLVGTPKTTEQLPANTTLGELYSRLARKFPRLQSLQKSTLMAVGVDYQDRNYVLRDGDEVSLFPPVQGG